MSMMSDGPPRRALPLRLLGALVPDPPVLKRPGVRVLLASRALSELGMSALTYGAIVHLAREGGSPFEVSLLGASGALAALIFGLRGGIIADSLTKRWALGLGYAFQAVLCVAVPTYLGTGLPALLALVFTVRLLTQIVSPAVKTAVSVVATAPELATLTTFLILAGGIGSGVGSGVLAPLLVKLFDIRILFYAIGLILALASIRAFALPLGHGPGVSEEASASERPVAPGLWSMTGWILDNPAVSTIILSGAIVAVMADVSDTLQPVYVRSVLGTDPANTIYVFAPGAIGSLLGTVLAPFLIRWPGERWLAALSVIAFAVAMAMFGLIEQVTPWLAPLNPLRLLNEGAMGLEEPILAAGMIAVPAKFGAAAAAVSVQTYVNTRVPIAGQGTTFGIQATLQSGLGIVGTLGLGALADALGTRFVYLVAPALVTAGVIWLIRTSYRAGNEPAPSRRATLASLWKEPGDADVVGPDHRRDDAPIE